MDKNVISQLSDFLFGFFKKNKGIQKIKSDFSEAVTNEILIFWQNVRPIFIQEDETLVKQIEEDPENETLQGGMKYQLSKKIENESFAEEVSKLLSKINAIKEKEGSGTTNIGIQANKVKMEGKYVGGIQNIKKS